MKQVVKFTLFAGMIVNVASSALEDFSGYKGMHWHEGIIAEVRSHFPGQEIDVECVFNDTGSVAAVVFTVQS